MSVEVKTLPHFHVAYIRRYGSYFEPQQHWDKLIRWAMDHALYPPDYHFIGISLDDPGMVEGPQCRHDACVTIPKDFDKEPHTDVSFKAVGRRFIRLIRVLRRT